MRIDRSNELGEPGFKADKFLRYILSRINKFPLWTLLLTMIATVCVVYFPFLFQGQIFMYADIGSDTQNVYYPFFVSLADKILNGDFSMWNFTYGFGTNILTRQSDVSNIFTWIAFALGKSGIKFGLVYAHILKIFVTGYVCYFYLDTFKKFSPVSKVIAAYVYAFNGFTVLWGQHYTFGTACLYIVLMLFAIEKSFQSNKGYLWVVFAAFTVMRNTYYLSYMVLLVAALYTIFRLIAMCSVKDIGKAVKKIGGLLCAVIVGGCMSAAFFLPSVALILGTSTRVSGGPSLVDKLAYYATSFTYDDETMQGIVSRLFSNNLMGIQDYSGSLNYYEMPQWFFSSFTVLIAVIFISDLFLDKEEKVKTKILKLTGAILMCALAFHPLLSVVLNGFVTHFFRYTFVVMPLLALCYAEVLDKILYRKPRFAKIQIFCAAGIFMALLAYNIVWIDTPSRIGQVYGFVYLGMMLLLALTFAASQNALDSSFKRDVCILCVIAIFVTNVSAESYTATNARTYTSEINQNIYLTNGNDDVDMALNYLDETDSAFYRVEKTFQDVSYLNDSMLEGYYGISAYNSVINKDIIEFVAQVCPEFKALQPDGYYDFRGVLYNMDFVSLLGVKYVLSYDPLDEHSGYSYVKSFGDVKLYENTFTDGIAKFFTNAIPYDSFVAMDEEARRNTIKDTIIIEGLEATVTGNADVGETVLTFSKPKNSSCVAGTVRAAQGGWVCLSIPNEAGWSVYVDGEKAELLTADIAFCAVEVTAGEHTVEFRYNTPLLKEGTVVSCVGFVLFGLWVILVLRKERKKL